MRVETFTISNVLLKKQVKEYTLFTTDRSSKQRGHIILPSVEKIIYIGINCDFKVSEDVIQVIERESAQSRFENIILPIQDKTYKLYIEGEPSWLSITFTPLVYTRFTQGKIQPINFDKKLVSIGKSSSDFQAICKSITTYLTSIYNPAISVFAERILLLVHKGTSIEEIAKQLNISSRTLYRYFKNHSGYNPSLFFRIMRLNTVLNKDAFTDQEVNMDFYDASHFTRECRHFMGLTHTMFVTNYKKVTNTVYQQK